jgi:isopentenyl-diphosphate delta-isomerase
MSEQVIPAWRDGILQPVPKIEVHRLALRHPAISVFVMRGREVLLQRRALEKYHTPGLWTNTCCTHPGWNETAPDCAARRLREELGITGLTLRAQGQIEYRADVGGGLHEHEVVQIFVAEASSDLKIDADPAEVMQVRWIDRADLKAQIDARPERFTPWLRIYLDRMSDSIFGPEAAASLDLS